MIKAPARHLITTALEESWPDGEQVLFLGEWTRRHSRRHVWQAIDGVVATPFGMNNSQREIDFKYIIELSERLLGELSESLNQIHGTHYAIRYWRIILGHWLVRYVSHAFNRYFTVDQALKLHSVSATTVLEHAPYYLVTQNSLSFIWACNDDMWNHAFYAKIFEFRGDLNLINKPLISSFKPFNISGAINKKSYRKKIIDLLRYTLPVLSRKNDAFFINTHLPLWREWALQLSLWQIPQLWGSPPQNVKEVNVSMRINILKADDFLGFERFIRLLLGEVLPISYLEGYADLCSTVQNLPWPKNPKFIYTTSNFDLDEVFKVWAATRVLEGAPYFVGQHGAGYGTHKYFQTSHMPEQKAVDKFLTWGWSDDTGRKVPAFIFNSLNLKPRQSVQDGGLLLVEASMLNQITHWDNYYEFGIYQEEQFKFMSVLPEAIRAQTLVRLHGSFKKFDWADLDRWQKRDERVVISDGGESISSQIGKSRLAVFAYDSTGFLECLNLNIPTIAFWQRGFAHLLPDAIARYQPLLDAGLIYFDAKNAANHVSMVWDSIETWWMSEKVQNAKSAFCEHYAKNPVHPIRDLKEILLNEK